MKRLILMPALSVITLQATWTRLNVTQEADGTMVFTLEASGDINKEFTPVSERYAEYTPSDLIKDYLTTTELKVVTRTEITMNNGDLGRICGMADTENSFPNLNTLDLEFANLTNDGKLVNLKYMDKLKIITFPRTTKEIPQACLNYDSCKTENVIIPDNAERSVGVGAQAFPQSLKTIKLGEVNPNDNSKIKRQIFRGYTNLTSVDFGYGWKEVDTQAFAGYSALEDIVLPEGAGYIRNGAFSGAAVEAIHLPNTPGVIEENTFVCKNLKTITIPTSVEKIKTHTFQDNKALIDVYILGMKTKVENQTSYEQASASFGYTGPSDTTPLKRESCEKFGSDSPLAALYCPRDAKKDYIDEHSRTPGGTTNSMLAENSEIWPTKEDGKYTVQHGDYAGWKNFVLVGGNERDGIWDDDKRVDGRWYTMCLPFDMTAQQLKSAYGSKVKAVEFSGVGAVTKSDRNKTITLKFRQPITEAKAYHPYMTHPSLHKGTRTGVKTTIVGIKKQEERKESLDAQRVVNTVDSVTYAFVGDYDKNKYLRQYSYYHYSGDNEGTYKNGFYKWIAFNSGTWTPYTACALMDKDNGAGARPSVDYYLGSIDEQTTAIGTLPIMPAIYDIQQEKIYTITE